MAPRTYSVSTELLLFPKSLSGTSPRHKISGERAQTRYTATRGSGRSRRSRGDLEGGVPVAPDEYLATISDLIAEQGYEEAVQIARRRGCRSRRRFTLHLSQP